MYIPKGKIDPKVYYTTGGEWYYSTTRTSYEGFYHLDFYGRAWTGKTHTTQSIRLVKPPTDTQVTNDSINSTNSISNQYSSVLSKNQLTKSYLSSMPTSDSLPPTQDDYDLGFYTRYILQLDLSTKPYFIEVSRKTYFQYVNSTQSTFYKSVEVPWKISGPLYDQKENGVLIQGGVIDSNIRSINKAQQTMPDIKNYLTDLTLYYRP